MHSHRQSPLFCSDSLFSFIAPSSLFLIPALTVNAAVVKEMKLMWRLFDLMIDLVIKRTVVHIIRCVFIRIDGSVVTQ